MWGPGRSTDLIELVEDLTSQLPGSNPGRAG